MAACAKRPTWWNTATWSRSYGTACRTASTRGARSTRAKHRSRRSITTRARAPAKDEAAGQLCKAYGAPSIMRIPGRIRITWQDDNTLKIETDQGQQTRLFHFGGAPPARPEPSLQGYSSARWEGSLSTLATQN